MQQAIFQINNKTYHFNVEDDLAQMAQTVDAAEFERLLMMAFRDYFVQKEQCQPKRPYRIGALPDMVIPDNFDEIEMTDFDE